jgi:hypothetical protein
MTLTTETVITSISNLSITLRSTKTLTILTDSKIPESAQGLGGVMYPNPDKFLTDMVIDQATYGTNGAEKIDISYSLHYVFCDFPVGANRSLGANFDVLLADTLAILNKIAISDTIGGASDFQLGELEGFGVIADPSGKQFFGAMFKFDVQQFFEV